MPSNSGSQHREEHPVVTRTGTKAKVITYTGHRGELIWDTDRETLVELDGSLAGGRPTKYNQIRQVTTAAYTVADDDTFVGVDRAGAVAITLPAGADGQRIVIKDLSGLAGTNNITITPDGIETIDGAATKVINTNYGSIELLWLGANSAVV